jgi:hypothetical protein
MKEVARLLMMADRQRLLELNAQSLAEAAAPRSSVGRLEQGLSLVAGAAEGLMLQGKLRRHERTMLHH